MTVQLPTNSQPPSQNHRDQRRPGLPPRNRTYDLITILVIGTAMVLVTLLVILFIQQNDDSNTATATEDTLVTAQTLPPPTGASTSRPAAPTPAPAQTTTPASTPTSAPITAGTSVTTTTIAGPGSTATTGPAIEQDPAQPFVWPQLTSEPGFVTPEAAARSFAGFLAGYSDPVLSEFRQGDNRSGEIDVQPTASGPITTILLRQIGPEDTWTVIAATSDNIIIEQPTTGDKSKPMTITGRSQTPDGNLQYALYAHGQTEAVATGTISAQTDELGPFTATIDWPDREPGPGTLRLFTTNQIDGSTRETTIIPIRF